MSDENETTYRETIQQFLHLYRYLRGYGRRLHQEGISGRKISTLRYLIDAGPLTVGQLSDYLCISDSSTSALISWLEDRGYVTRTRSQVDNRVVMVDITTSGREIVQRTPLGGIPLLREALTTLPPDRLAVVHEAMTTLIDVLEIQDGR
jgi:MarR family 2-MHQ and catechol resistance regulon transcriptional repressor